MSSVSLIASVSLLKFSQQTSEEMMSTILSNEVCLEERVDSLENLWRRFIVLNFSYDKSVVEKESEELLKSIKMGVTMIYRDYDRREDKGEEFPALWNRVNSIYEKVYEPVVIN